MRKKSKKRVLLRIVSGQIVCSDCARVLKEARYAVKVGTAVLMEREATTCPNCGKKQILPLGFNSETEAEKARGRKIPQEEVIISWPD